MLRVWQDPLAGTDYVNRFISAEGVIAALRGRKSPAEVALSMMNNLAYAQGMKAAFRYSYYVGTIGPYDRNVRRMSSR